MKKNLEIEAKYQLFNLEEVADYLDNNVKSGKKENDVKQCDTYFIPCHNNFLDHNPITEWLRLRETDTEYTINYKKWEKGSLNGNTIICQELETTVESSTTLSLILKKLDFKEIIIVQKTRTVWNYDNKFLIALDRVNELGDFIEIEYVNKIGDYSEEQIMTLFEDLLKKINAKVGHQNFKGYPSLLLEKKGAAKCL